MSDLLVAFLRDEATDYVRNIILDAVNEYANRNERSLCKFEFNRFDLTLDFRKNIAIIEDVLNSESIGALTLGLDEFVRIIAEIHS